MSPLPALLLLLACRTASVPPPAADAAAARDEAPAPLPTAPPGAPAGPLAGVALPGTWKRLAWLEGAWVTPPESGTLPPLEIDRSRTPPVLVSRTGAGTTEWPILGASIRSGVTTLRLDRGQATFGPYVSEAANAMQAPPQGAWSVALPDRPVSGNEAWYGGN